MTKLTADIKVEYIPCPPEHAAEYWEGVRILYRLLRELAKEEQKTMEWIMIGIAALVSALILLVEHYLPLTAWFGKLHATTNYILGMLGILLPLTGLLVVWQLWLAIAAVWVITVVGGLSVLGAYALDGWQAMRQRIKAAELEAQLLRPEVEHAEIER